MKRKRPQDGNYLGHKKTTKLKAKERVIFNYFIIPAYVYSYCVFTLTETNHRVKYH